MGKKSMSWREVVGSEGFYYVSDQGEVMSFRGTGRYPKKLTVPKKLNPYLNSKRGYLYITLRLPYRKNWAVHRLVAEHFLSMSPDKSVVHHIDFNRLNNTTDNLMWVTQEENYHYSKNAGRMDIPTDMRRGGALLSKDEVKVIRLLKGVLTYNEIAERFGVKYSTVAHIMRGSRWGDV